MACDWCLDGTLVMGWALRDSKKGSGDAAFGAGSAKKGSSLPLRNALFSSSPSSSGLGTPRWDSPLPVPVLAEAESEVGGVNNPLPRHFDGEHSSPSSSPRILLLSADDDTRSSWYAILFADVP